MKKTMPLVFILLALILSSAYAQMYGYEQEIMQKKLRTDLGIDDFKFLGMRGIKICYLGDLQLYEIRFFSQKLAYNISILPSPEHLGYFILNNGKFVYLLQNDTEIAAIMKTYFFGKKLSEQETIEFLLFIYSQTANVWNENVYIIRSFGDLENPEFKKYYSNSNENYYTLKNSIINKYHDYQFPMVIDENDLSCTFYIISGWMHEIDTLQKITISVKNDTIEYHNELLEKDIYDNIPLIAY